MDGGAVVIICRKCLDSVLASVEVASVDSGEGAVIPVKPDEELLSPERYLSLTSEEKAEILTAQPMVKPLGASSLNDDFAFILARWKRPKYRANL